MIPASQQRSAGLLLDTNMLILLVVGVYARAKISAHDLTASYRPEDFDLLDSLMSGFSRFATTPNILTEASNLLGGGKEKRNGKEKKYRSELALLARLVDNPNFIEIYQPSQPIMTDQSPLFLKFGLSDMATCEVVKQDYTLLTADANLYYYLVSNGYSAVNFNHLRVTFP
jgi:hypothetical protein